MRPVGAPLYLKQIKLINYFKQHAPHWGAPFFRFFKKKTRLRDIKTAPCNACDGKHLLDMQHTHICQNTIGHVKITYAYVSATLRTYGPHSAWAHALFGGTPAPDIETIATLCTHTHTHTHTHTSRNSI